ncbi:MAG: AEC family transporter [Acholeplasmatales bacterium]|nr:AEC family transporter [Acholeplasmatales bacterium]
MEHLQFTLNAILPILLPVFLGYFLKRIGFVSKNFLNECNKIVFGVFIPILLFSNLYQANLKSIDWAFVGFSAAAILALFFIGMVVVMFIPDKKQKGVMLQAAFRSNYAIIGIPLAMSLGGDSAKAAASIVAAATVPLFNILAVIALTIYDKEEGNAIDIKKILKKIATNPLIIGVFSGLLVCFISMGINEMGGNVSAFLNNDATFIPKTISSIANLATPLALIVLGGKFEFKAVKALWKQLTISCSLRLVITPAVFLTVAYFLGFDSVTEFAILIALFATPIAVSSAPMAAQMGQDEELAGQIVVWTSALSAISLFIIILICSGIGIF